MLALAVAAAGAAPLEAPSGLMVELLAEPSRTAIHDPRPEFSWIVPGETNEAMQAAYQVQVAATAAALDSRSKRLWDSGRRESDRSLAVEYAGRPLAAGGSYAWRVRTWNAVGRASTWSEPQAFRMGALWDGPAGESRHRPDRTEWLTVARYPVIQSEVRPVRIVRTAADRWFLDFGRVGFAGLTLTLGTDVPRDVRVVLGEALDPPDRVHRSPGGSVRTHLAALALRPGRHPYVIPLGPRDGRLMTADVGPVMPFRYVEIEGYPGPVLPGDALQRVAHYPFQDSAAEFSCSDPRLTAVWELCKYSIKATTFGGVYVDGDRERLPYEADAYINQLGHYAVDREFTLARYSHEHLMRNSTWPTEWILFTVLIAWEDYLATGDAESLRAFYPDLQAKTLRALARPDGLIGTVEPPVTPGLLKSVYSPRMRDIVDWPAGERDGYDFRPVNTVVNAFHYRALALMERIADVLGNEGDARMYRREAARVADAMERRLVDPVTGLSVDGEGSSHSSLHANMFCAAFGLVPPARRDRVADFLVRKGMACSVYGAQFLLEALYRLERAEHARRLITAPGDRSWGHMLDRGTTITYEAWDNRYKPNQDWNHAWGAAPANILPRMLMGVEPLEPGYRRVRLRPQPGGLTHATIRIPTIRGPIEETVEATPGRFRMQVRLPGNTRAEAWLPRMGQPGREVTVDGRRVEGREDGDWVVVELGPGPHVLQRGAELGRALPVFLRLYARHALPSGRSAPIPADLAPQSVRLRARG